MVQTVRIGTRTEKKPTVKTQVDRGERRVTRENGEDVLGTTL